MESTPETADSAFARNLAGARRARDLNQQAVAAAMNVRGFTMPATAISKIEKGDRRVSIGEASALAEIVGMPLERMIVAPSEFRGELAPFQQALRAMSDSSRQYAHGLLRLAQILDQVGYTATEEEERLFERLIAYTEFGGAIMRARRIAAGELPGQRVPAAVVHGPGHEGPHQAQLRSAMERLAEAVHESEQATRRALHLSADPDNDGAP